jgi:hypothetical protein
VNVLIPSFLQKHILQFGAEGTQWLARLPRRIVQLEQEWGFRVGPAFDHGGAVSWVAPVELGDGSEAVLKIGLPHDEARFEAAALRFLDGRGAVRLLRASADGFALLLERCLPGTDLWSLGEEEGDAVACRLLTCMWREPAPRAPFLSLSDYVANGGPTCRAARPPQDTRRESSLRRSRGDERSPPANRGACCSTQETSA